MNHIPIYGGGDLERLRALVHRQGQQLAELADRLAALERTVRTGDRLPAAVPEPVSEAAWRS